MIDTRAHICAIITYSSGATLKIFENDHVTNLKYKYGNEIHTISGNIRVICANTNDNNGNTDYGCPPRQNIQDYIEIYSLIIDLSENYSANTIEVYIKDIISIEKINEISIDAIVGDVIYQDLDLAISDSIKYNLPIAIMKNYYGNIVIPMGSNLLLSGCSTEITVNGNIEIENNDNIENLISEIAISDITLKSNNNDIGIISLNESYSNNIINLNINNVIFVNYIKSALLISNASNANIMSCIFNNCACGDGIDKTNRGDYTIFFNQFIIQNTNINIANIIFKNNCGNKSIIQCAIRGGDFDDNSLIPNNIVEASIDNLIIDGCEFISKNSPADISIGLNNDNITPLLPNTTGRFPVEIINSLSDVKLKMLSYGIDRVICIPIGYNATKTINGRLYIKKE